MAIKIISTKDQQHSGCKVLVYGDAGVGKTVLCATAPDPIIISAESGLLSLAKVDIPAVEVNNMQDVIDVYNWATTSKEADKYQTLCLDSITEIAEVMLSQYKKEEKDPRAAYGRLADDMSSMIRGFRDIRGKHVYFSAKEIKLTDDIGVNSYVPSMPGKQLLNGLPFFFDEVFPLLIGRLEDKTVFRYLQTHGDVRRVGKDRSGNLAKEEEPNLAKLFDKCMGITPKPDKKGVKKK